MPCRSGSPQGVFGAGVWADVAGTEAEMAAPNAAAAMATVPIEPEKGARMMVLLYLNTFNCSHGNGIGFKPQPMLSPVSRTSSLTEQANSSVAVPWSAPAGQTFPSMQRRLVINSVLPVFLPGELLPGG